MPGTHLSTVSGNFSEKNTFVAVVLFAVVGVAFVVGVTAGVTASFSENTTAQEVESEDEELDEELTPEELADMKVVVEAILAIVFLLALLYGLKTGQKNGAKIFLMADVNFLFPSPMRPQAVLLFQLSGAVWASVYLLFQMPSLAVEMGFGSFAVLMIVAAYILLLVYIKLMSLLSYVVLATWIRLRKYLTPFMFSSLGQLLEYLFPASEMNPVRGLVQFFVKFLMGAFLVVILFVGTLFLPTAVVLSAVLLAALGMGIVCFVFYPTFLHDGV